MLTFKTSTFIFKKKPGNINLQSIFLRWTLKVLSPTDHVSSLRPNLFTHTSETMSDYPRNGVFEKINKYLNFFVHFKFFSVRKVSVP